MGSTKPLSTLQPTEPNPNRSQWETFLAEFSPDQKKQFLKNITLHFSRIMTKMMNQQKEAMRRLKESHNPR